MMGGPGPHPNDELVEKVESVRSLAEQDEWSPTPCRRRPAMSRCAAATITRARKGMNTGTTNQYKAPQEKRA